MKTGQIKIIELFIVERVQLAYCGEVTFMYYNEKQFTPITEAIFIEGCPDFESCLKSLKKLIRNRVSEERDKDYAKKRRKAGWY